MSSRGSKQTSVSASYSKFLATSSLASVVTRHSNAASQTLPRSGSLMSTASLHHSSRTHTTLPATNRVTSILSGTDPHSASITSQTWMSEHDLFDTRGGTYGSRTRSVKAPQEHHSDTMASAKYDNAARLKREMNSTSSTLDKEHSHLSEVRVESTSSRYNFGVSSGYTDSPNTSATCDNSAGRTPRDRRRQNQTDLKNSFLEEKAPDKNGSSLFSSSAANLHREIQATSKESSVMFGCCELRLNLTQSIWEYIEKYHQQELKNISRSCQLSVTQRSEGELCLEVKTSSYDDLINKFQVIFGPLYDSLCTEITVVETELVRGDDCNKTKEKLKKHMKCVAHLTEGGHFQVICKKADRHIAENILQDSVLRSAEFDTVESLPAAGFEPTGYTVNGRVGVVLHMNDITSLNVDAIINPANPTLEAFGGLFSVIALAAGTELEVDCHNTVARMGRNLTVGEVVHTTAGRLPARYVLHVTGPQCPKNPVKEDVQECYYELVNVFQNVIKYADGIRLRKIAIPPISSGINGVPCAIVALAAHKIIDVLSKTKYLEEIHFVDLAEEFLLRLQQLFEEDKKLGKVVQNSADETLSRISSLIGSLISGRAPRNAPTATGISWNTPDVMSLSDRRRNEEEADHFGMDEQFPGSQSSSDTDFTDKCFFVNHSVKVILSKQDISKMRVDAIVNPTNARMKRDKGISRLLETKAGSDYIADCQKYIRTYGSQRMSDVLCTRAGDLPCKMVFHAVTPRWSSRNKRECIADLQATLSSVFIKAKQAQIQSIACPVIGGGTAGFPHDVIASVMFEELRKSCSPRSHLKEVYIVDIRGQILDVVYKVFHEGQTAEFCEDVTGEDDLKEHHSTSLSRNLVADMKNKPSVEPAVSRDVRPKEKRNSSQNEKLLNQLDDNLIRDKHQENHPKSKCLKISTENPPVRSSAQGGVTSGPDSEYAMAVSSSGSEEQPGSSCKLLSKNIFTDKCFLVNRSVKVILSKQDISEMTVDAVIHPIGRRQQHTKGLDELLEKKAGRSYVAEYQKLVGVLSNLGASEVKETCSGDLPCRMVLHAVFPRWSTKKEKQVQCIVDLETTFHNVFTLTESSRLHTVVFPANIKDVVDIPCSEVTRVLCDTLLQTVTSESYLKKVYIVDLSDDILDNIYSVLHIHQADGYFEEIDDCSGTGDSEATDGSKVANEEGATGNKFDDCGDNLEPHSVKSCSMKGPNVNKQKAPSSSVASVNSADDDRMKLQDELSLEKSHTPERNRTVKNRILPSGEEQVVSLKEESQLPEDKNSETSRSNRHLLKDQGNKEPLDSVDHRTEKTVPSKEQKHVETTLNSEDEKCVICLQSMIEPKTLACSHTFCQNCIQVVFSKYQPKCPCCGRLYGVCRGNQPKGTMKTDKLNSSLPGYDGHKTIVINYEIPDGIQGEDHPNPGRPYRGTCRTAYLPDNAEGREVLALLKKAFDARLVFTIGHSVTTGAEDVVTWNDIHHKTSTHGSSTCYGYPDPTYLTRVRQELADKGIK